jgi:aminomethyltransferase
LLLAEGATSSKGDAVFAGDKQVGEVTSSAVSPQMGAPIALAYVQRDHTGAGTELVVKNSDKQFPARVQPLPFRPR